MNFYNCLSINVFWLYIRWFCLISVQSLLIFMWYSIKVHDCKTEGKNGGERSTWLECALGVSLLMFGAMLERCCALLPEAPQSQHHTDALLLLPAIKVTCTHSYHLSVFASTMFWVGMSPNQTQLSPIRILSWHDSFHYFRFKQMSSYSSYIITTVSVLQLNLIFIISP